MPDDESAIHRPGLARFAKLTFAATFCLLIAGSLVTTTGSGLAVPDWPLSFGRFFPEMKGGVLFEHGHRMIAATVGLLTTALAVWIWLVERRRWVKWLGLGAWIAVVCQAILGGITVLNKLPTPVSVSHAMLAMTFFSLVTVIALVTSRSWFLQSRLSNPAKAGMLLLPGIATVGIIFLQIILGATMRHLGAGLAIPDFPLAWGRLIPPRLDIPSVAVHFAHRVVALLVGVMIVWLARSIHRQTRPDDRLRTWSRILVALYIAQFMLGAWTIWSMKSAPVVTLHVAFGALTLSLSVLILTKLLGLAALGRTHRARAVVACEAVA